MADANHRELLQLGLQQGFAELETECEAIHLTLAELREKAERNYGSAEAVRAMKTLGRLAGILNGDSDLLEYLVQRLKSNSTS